MTVEHVELLVEEPSMEAALRLLLPKVLGDLSFEIYQHLCKDELLLRLPQRLRGYGQRCKSDAWFRDHCRIVVVIDRDDDDCARLKRRLCPAPLWCNKIGLPSCRISCNSVVVNPEAKLKLGRIETDCMSPEYCLTYGANLSRPKFKSVSISFFI